MWVVSEWFGRGTLLSQWLLVMCEARKRILEDSSAVKQGMQAASALSAKLPHGGKTSRLRRNVSLLSESLAIGLSASLYLVLLKMSIMGVAFKLSHLGRSRLT